MSIKDNRLALVQYKEAKNRKRWWMLACMATSLILAMSTWFSASAVIPQLREVWKISSTSAAWLTIAVQMGFVCGALISSLLNLSDIISPRHIILGGAIGAAIANMSLLGTNGIVVAILIRFTTGFFLAGVYPPSFKLISTWFRSGRGLALGILASAIVLGSGMPHLVNGLGGLDWRLVIYLTSVLTILGGLIPELIVKQGPFAFPVARFDPWQIAGVFANPGVRMAIIGYVGHMWELFALYAWYSIFLNDMLLSHGFSAGMTSAYATFAIFVAGSFGCWLGGILADRWGRTNSNILMLSISGTCAFVIGLFFDTFPWIVLLIGLVWGFTVVADSAQFSTMVTELANQSYVGTALTIQLSAGYTITVITIWLIPLLKEAFGWRWAFAFLAPGPILGVLSMLKLKSLPVVSRIAGGKG